MVVTFVVYCRSSKDPWSSCAVVSRSRCLQQGLLCDLYHKNDIAPRRSLICCVASRKQFADYCAAAVLIN